MINAQGPKESIPPATYYRNELPGMRTGISGSQWVDGGLCPFHLDRRPGSFKIELISGAFKCFSCGASGGDIIAFEQAKKRMSFRDALESLAHTWGTPK
jgi:CHC2-type zinc finger protein